VRAIISLYYIRRSKEANCCNLFFNEVVWRNLVYTPPRWDELLSNPSSEVNYIIAFTEKPRR